jgi:hypothetical protein
MVTKSGVVGEAGVRDDAPTSVVDKHRLFEKKSEHCSHGGLIGLGLLARFSDYGCLKGGIFPPFVILDDFNNALVE